MFLPRLFVRRPVMAVMLAVAMIFFGLIANAQIGVSLFPDVEFPIITITSELPGADPEIVEQELIVPIEDAVTTLSGIRHLRSISSQGIGQVFVEFETTVDVDVAAQDVRDRIQTVLRLLPPEAETPTVEKLDLDAMPILAVIISGPEEIREVTAYAENIRERLQQVDGVGTVRRIGGREREIRIWLDAHALEAHALTPLDVVAALQRENVEVPGGRFEEEDALREMTVKTDARLAEVGDFEALILTQRQDTPIRLGYVATVEDGLEEERTLARFNGEPAVSLQVQRMSGTNIVEVAERVKAEIADIQAVELDAGSGYELFVTQDMSHFVQISIGAVQTDIAIGATFTFFVIFFFLFNRRLTFVAVVIIPTSILATLATIHAFGFTLNNVTMLAISLVVGLVVDDTIVMLENIYRHYESGKTRMQAALDGSQEIGFAIITVSMVLMAVFVPVGLMTGLVGQFFFEFGVTVAVAIAWSLTLALTLTPMLCSTVIRRRVKLGPVARRIDFGLGVLDRWYRVVLRIAIRRRLVTIGVAFGVLFMSFVVAGMFMQTEFTPQDDRGEFNVNVRLDAQLGASPRRTEAVLNEVERIVRENPYVVETYLAVGGDAQQSANLGQLFVTLTPWGTRPSEIEIREQVRGRLAQAQQHGELPRQMTLDVSEIAPLSGGGFATQPVQYLLQGPDSTVLQGAADRLAALMEEVPGITDVMTSAEAGQPELAFRVDRERASDLGVSAQAIGQVVQTFIGGIPAGTFHELGEQVDIHVRLTPQQRERIDELLALSVRSETTGELVPLSNVTTLIHGEGPTQIDRFARERQVTVFANLGPVYEGGPSLALGDAVTAVERIVEEHEIVPEGPYSGQFVGFAEMMEDAFSEIFITMLISAFIIYALLASLFNSFVQPVTIMTTVPLAIAGGIFALVISQYPTSIITMIGFLMLFGLVTKNAIILLDFITRYREQGRECNEAILDAAPLRLRPIMMTAVSTIAAMIPVAFFGSEGSEVRAPMAIAVIGGMILATALTLLVVPAVYSLFDSLSKNPLTRALGRFISPPETEAPGANMGATTVRRWSSKEERE